MGPPNEGGCLGLMIACPLRNLCLNLISIVKVLTNPLEVLGLWGLCPQVGWILLSGLKFQGANEFLRDLISYHSKVATKRGCPLGIPMLWTDSSTMLLDFQPLELCVKQAYIFFLFACFVLFSATGNELSKKSNKITCCNTGNRDLRALHKETLRIETQESAGMRFRRGGQAIVLTKMEHSQKKRKVDTMSHLLTGSSQKNRSVMGLRWRSLSWDFPDTNPMSCSIVNNSYIPYLPSDSVYDLKVVCWLRN